MTITPVIRRNLYLSLASAVCVLVVGGFLFHNSAVGDYVVPGIAFFGSFVLLTVLNDREWRRQERGGETPSV
ncbi:MAG TPA: hypothetical protein VFY04_11070 [Solirubrobacterales bacterium]|nr:hypothetical protein [Solirubrobacterales bacterium]